MSGMFFKPEGAWAADVIPFYKDGTYHLFYLLDWRDKAGHGEGTPWYQISTRDFVHVQEHGEMLPRDGPDAQDLYVFTGSVLEAPDGYHIFYTGHNPHLRAQGRPEQGVMHAVSEDLLHWRKVPEDTFFSPAGRYEPHDWRDPYVFWNPEAGEYWMLLAARLHGGPSRRRGCTALCASRDLRAWEVHEPLYAPALYYTHECPDLFPMGDWWYLIFSEFSEAVTTRYRMSRSPTGPWLTPAVDTFDNRAFYAAKTAGDGQRRFLFGWNPTRDPQTDAGRWQWGGNLVVHEVRQQPGGELVVVEPATVAAAFGSPRPVALQPALGRCRAVPGGMAIDAAGTYGCATAGPLPETCRLTTTVTVGAGTRGCGLVLRAGADLEEGYQIRLEPERRRLVLDRWPRPHDLPHMVELERPLEMVAGQPMGLTVLVDGTVCEVYAGGRVAMSARLYDLPAGLWGAFVQEGTARFDATHMATPGR